MSKLLAIFAPAASDRWSLRLEFDQPELGLPGKSPYGPVPGLGRPVIDSLNAHMSAARAGCIIRVRADGAIEISATDRSALALQRWLTTLVDGVAVNGAS